MRVTYHPDARLELLEAAAHYKKRSPHAKKRFLEAVNAAVKAMQRAPTRFPLARPGVRRCPLRKFPYSLLFRLLPDSLRVIAVKHDRRHPDYWQYRLTDQDLS